MEARARNQSQLPAATVAPVPKFSNLQTAICNLSDSMPLLLYDGTCGFCASSVRFVLRHERRDTLRFAALQSAFGQAVIARHPDLRGIDSMVWVDPAADGSAERVSVRSEAALRVLAYLGGWWTLLLPGRLVPRPVRDSLYRLIARHRHRLGGEQCFVMGEEVRRRFIEE